jgi:hypothetical protein
MLFVEIASWLTVGLLLGGLRALRHRAEGVALVTAVGAGAALIGGAFTATLLGRSVPAHSYDVGSLLGAATTALLAIALVDRSRKRERAAH